MCALYAWHPPTHVSTFFIRFVYFLLQIAFNKHVAFAKPSSTMLACAATTNCYNARRSEKKRIYAVINNTLQRVQCTNNLTVENHFQFYCIELLGGFFSQQLLFIFAHWLARSAFAKSQTESTLINPLDSERIVFGLGRFLVQRFAMAIVPTFSRPCAVLFVCWRISLPFSFVSSSAANDSMAWAIHRNRREMRLFSIFHVFRLNLLSLFLTVRALLPLVLLECDVIVFGVRVRLQCAMSFSQSIQLEHRCGIAFGNE